MGSGASQQCPSDAKLRRTMLIKTHNAMVQSKQDQDIPTTITTACKRIDTAGTGMVPAANFENFCKGCGVMLREKDLSLLQKRFSQVVEANRTALPNDQINYMHLLAFLRNDVAYCSATPPPMHKCALTQFPTSPKRRLQIDSMRLQVRASEEPKGGGAGTEEEDAEWIASVRVYCAQQREHYWMDAERQVVALLEEEEKSGTSEQKQKQKQKQQSKGNTQKANQQKNNSKTKKQGQAGFQPDNIIQYVIVDTQAKDGKNGKPFSKGRMAAQVSHISVMATHKYLSAGSSITKDYVEEKHGQMTTVVFKLKKGVTFSQVAQILDDENAAAAGCDSNHNPFRYVIWNENPEKVDVAMALEPVLFGNYQRVQGKLRDLLGLY